MAPKNKLSLYTQGLWVTKEKLHIDTSLRLRHALINGSSAQILPCSKGGRCSSNIDARAQVQVPNLNEDSRFTDVIDKLRKRMSLLPEGKIAVEKMDCNAIKINKL